MNLSIVLRSETCFELLNGRFVWWRCVFGQFSSYCGPTQMVTNDQSSPNLVCDFFVYKWLLLWCEEVLATIRLVFVDENQYFESKIVYKWCSERKPTLPIKLPMLLDDDLHIDEDWLSFRGKGWRLPRVAARDFGFHKYFDRFLPQGGYGIYCYCTCIYVRGSPTYYSS